MSEEEGQYSESDSLHSDACDGVIGVAVETWDTVTMRWGVTGDDDGDGRTM